jgi:hypothetical protein
VVGDGQFAFPIVGESHYQSDLEALAGGRSEEGAHQLCAALLEPEPDNPYDKNAVRVKVRSRTVGYLSQDVAPDFVAALQANGFASAACEAVIVGGWHRPGQANGHFGLRLNASMPFDLVEPDEPRLARGRRNPPRIVRLVKRRRGLFGTIFLLLFALFNLFMVAWLVSYWPALFPLAAINGLGSRIGAALGFGLSAGLILAIWACGAIVLGLLMWLTPGGRVVDDEVTEDWAATLK